MRHIKVEGFQICVVGGSRLASAVIERLEHLTHEPVVIVGPPSMPEEPVNGLISGMYRETTIHEVTIRETTERESLMTIPAWEPSLSGQEARRLRRKNKRKK